MENAGFFRRIFSLIYDSFAVLGIILSFTLLLVLVNGEAPRSGGFADFLQLCITLLSGPVFYSYFWIANKGQTLGMQAWKIQLISNKNGLSVKDCLYRCFISVISFLIFGIGYFLILFRKDNKSLADLLTKTQIIDLKRT